MKSINFLFMLFYLFLLLASVASTNPAYGTELNNLSILIPSCDKYSEAWDPFFKLLFKHWPTLNQKIYLIGGYKKYPDPRVHSILVGQEKSWSDNMLFALERIPDDYVLIFLEDYFLLNSVNEPRLKILFEQMQKEKAGYLSLVNVSLSNKIPHSTIAGLGYLRPEADYRTALQVAIWNKAVLKQLLVSGENPWNFEMKGTERSRSISMPFLVTERDGPIEYLGGIDRGHWNEKAIALLKKENLQVDFNLPIDNPFRRWLRGPFRGFIGYYVAKPIRRFFKKESTDNV